MSQASRPEPPPIPVRVGPRGFWREAFAWRSTTTLGLLSALAIVGAYTAIIIGLFHRYYSDHNSPPISFLTSVLQLSTTVVGFLIVIRLNVGYQRWWEARTLWGAIINQTRNLAITMLAHGPPDRAWRDRAVRWVACYGHVAMCNLRGIRELPQVAAILGDADAAEIAASAHMPSYVALRIGDHLRDAADNRGMDRFGFLQADRERSHLINHIGGCERILRTPVSRLYVIACRRMTLLLMIAAPFACLELVPYNLHWFAPLFTMIVFYPFLLLDEIAAELEDPFNTSYLGHLPLEVYAHTIESNLLALIQEDRWHE
jgi:putative membrane protein